MYIGTKKVFRKIKRNSPSKYCYDKRLSSVIKYKIYKQTNGTQMEKIIDLIKKEITDLIAN